MDNKHTQGEVVQGAYYETDIHALSGAVIAECKPMNTELGRANAKRIVALWNAADGMTTEEAVQALETRKEIGHNGHYLPLPKDMTHEEAVRYLEHGREIVGLLKAKCFDCKQDMIRVGMPSDEMTLHCEILCNVKKVITSVEGK